MPGEAIDLFSKFIPDGDLKSFAKRLQICSMMIS